MYTAICQDFRKNDKALELIHEPGIELHMHWLNPLLSIRNNV
jgi:hypothetical protein